MAEFKDFINVLKKCLIVDPDQRPDFITLFKDKFIKTKNLEKMKKFILLDDLNIF